MTVALIACRFRERFPNALPGLGASLRTDIASLGQWCTDAHGATVAGSVGEYFGEDPMADLEAVAATVELINAQLREQGFVPPSINYRDDPMGMLHETGAYYLKVAPLVSEPISTVH